MLLDESINNAENGDSALGNLLAIYHKKNNCSELKNHYNNLNDIDKKYFLERVKSVAKKSVNSPDKNYSYQIINESAFNVFKSKNNNFYEKFKDLFPLMPMPFLGTISGFLANEIKGAVIGTTIGVLSLICYYYNIKNDDAYDFINASKSITENLI